MNLSELRRKYKFAPKRPKGLRFFSELCEEAKEFAVENERNSGRRFDDDEAAFLTEDFQNQLAEKGFEAVKVFWSLGYCQGDGVAFYGRVYADNLKAKDSYARKLIERLEKAGDEISIEITGANNWYHHRNSMTVEIDFENELKEDGLPSRLKIALPALREEFEDYLSEMVKEISDELEKSGYAEIDYRYVDETISRDLGESENLYEKDGTPAMSGFEFESWRIEQELNELSAVAA
jgi:predicted dehydrogenase